MRKLAAFTVSFALGICLAQYLLPERLLLPVAAVFFAAACLGPGCCRDFGGKRVLLVGTGLALALGWNWLYSYAVRRLLRPCPQRGHRFHDSFGVRRPHGLRRQGDSEAGGGSPGQGGLLRRGGPAGPGSRARRWRHR